MSTSLEEWAKRASRVANPAGRRGGQRWRQKYADAADLLAEHNRWRAGAEGAAPTDPKELTAALELAIKELRQKAGRKPK